MEGVPLGTIILCPKASIILFVCLSMSYFNWCFPNSQSGWQSRGHQREFVGQLKAWNKALWGSKALTLSSSCEV